MSDQAWYDAGKSEEDRIYEEAVRRVRDAVVERSASFEEAAGEAGVEDEDLRAAVLSDALKVLLAELHFQKKVSLEDLAEKLKLPLQRLAAARREMLAEVKQAAIEQYKLSTGQKGNA